MKEIEVYILAGGQSSRMGTDKGLASIKGKPMIEYVIDVVIPLTRSISIVSSNEAYEVFGFPVIPDLIKDKGPVGGIYTALSNSKSQTNVILSCDTPFVTLKLIQKLIDCSTNIDICIPSFKGRIHPLIGVYKKQITDVYKVALDHNSLKLMEINALVNSLVIEVENESNEIEFANLNTINKLDRFV